MLHLLLCNVCSFALKGARPATTCAIEDGNHPFSDLVYPVQSEVPGTKGSEGWLAKCMVLAWGASMIVSACCSRANLGHPQQIWLISSCMLEDTSTTRRVRQACWENTKRTIIRQTPCRSCVCCNRQAVLRKSKCCNIIYV